MEGTHYNDDNNDYLGLLLSASVSGCWPLFMSHLDGSGQFWLVLVCVCLWAMVFIFWAVMGCLHWLLFHGWCLQPGWVWRDVALPCCHWGMQWWLVVEVVMQQRLWWMVVVLVEKEKGEDMPHCHCSWLSCIENLHVIIGNVAPASHEKKRRGGGGGASCYSPPHCPLFIIIV